MSQLAPQVIAQEVVRMFAERTGIDEKDITLDSKLNVDIVLDSLSYAELLMECEEKYGIEIPMDKANNFKTVQDIVDYLKHI